MSKWIEADRIKGVRNCHMYPFKSWGRYNPLLQCLYGQRKTVERVRNQPCVSFHTLGKIQVPQTTSLSNDVLMDSRSQIPSFWSIWEQQDSKFSSTMVKVSSVNYENSFVLEHLGAAKFKIFFNHVERIFIEL